MPTYPTGKSGQLLLEILPSKMSGIYVHVPFCKQRCSYCDFYTGLNTQLIPDYIEALVAELYKRKEYLPDKRIQSIYFGGGTPSVLSIQEFERVFQGIRDIYRLEPQAEITFEANPDDLTKEYLQQIKSLPFNRLSIGIQSFDNEALQGINRRHTGEQAVEAVKTAQQAGFDNISIDLIYGLPGQTVDNWRQQIRKALRLDIQHISAYGLTYEEGTQLWLQREKGLLQICPDEDMIAMYEILINELSRKGFEAYEISNFARAGYRSRHNSSYWKQIPYLGLGPSAHSFDLSSRQWNVASTQQYIKALRQGGDFFEREELSLRDRYNDYVMLSLRTSEGIDGNYLRSEFGTDWESYCLENIKSFIKTEKIHVCNGHFRLTKSGILISDHIMATLMKV